MHSNPPGVRFQQEIYIQPLPIPLINRCSLPSKISFTGWRYFADYCEILLRSRKSGEILPFVSVKYRSKCHKISLKPSSKLSNKEQNSRISNPRLLGNTVAASKRRIAFIPIFILKCLNKELIILTDKNANCLRTAV